MKKFFSYLWQKLSRLASQLALLIFILVCAATIQQMTKSWPIAHADTTISTSTSLTSVPSDGLYAASSGSEGSTSIALATPTGLIATSGACGTNSLYLSWLPVTGADGYRVYRSGTLMYTSTTYSYNDTNLTPSTSYSYTVHAFNAYGTSGGVSVSGRTSSCTNTGATTTTAIITTTSTATTTAIVPASSLVVAAVPAAPTNLHKGYETVTSITLEWTDNATNEDKFNIERKLSTATAYAALYQITSPNVTTYADTSAAPGVAYDYRIQACLSGMGCSGYTYVFGVSGVSSTPVSGTTTISAATTTTTNTTTTTIPVPPLNPKTIATTSTLVAATIPAAPSGLTFGVAPTDIGVSLRWTDNATNEDKFNIERKLSSTTRFIALTQINTANVTSYVDRNITRGVSYDYRVQACLSGTGCSEYVYLSGAQVPVAKTSLMYPTTTTIHTPTGSDTMTSVTPTATNENTTKPLLATTTATITSLSTTIVSTAAPRIIPQAIIATTSTELSMKIENVGLAVEHIKNAVNDTKTRLTNIITTRVDNIITNQKTSESNVSTSKIYAARDALIQKMNDSLLSLSTITPADIARLQNDVTVGINAIRMLAGEAPQPRATVSENATQITNTLTTLSTTVQEQSATLKQQSAELLYKDTNKDGISDYDSIHVYQMDPVKPSPVSLFEGKTVTASDKILLGFDPTKRELVKMTIEDPISSTAPVVSTYKIDEVSLTAGNMIVVTGRALPNSFVTVYIYSTPIIVTVKTNSQGEWQYTLDKELESGNHTIYTAMVNNAGNIVAKSPGYLFTRTAEAMTVTDTPAVPVTNVKKPGLFGDDIFYLILGVASGAIIIVGLMLILAGRGKREEIPTSSSNIDNNSESQ